MARNSAAAMTAHSSSVVCLLVIGVLLIVCCSPGDGTKRSYIGYHVVRIDLNGDDHWRTVEDLFRDESLQLEMWSGPSFPYDFVDVQVANHLLNRFVAKLDGHKIKHHIFIEDIQSLIELEDESDTYELLKDRKRSRRERRSATASISNKVVGRYAKLAEIETWMSMVAHHCPEIATLQTIGETYEGRKIYALKLGKEIKGRVRPAVYMDGAMHAREWISPATVIYIVYQLLSGYIMGDDETTYLMELLDWHFVPVANPDGYHFTHTTERLWRKNRSPTANSTCVGTDLNRNWPYHWGHVSPFTSANPCSIVYLGAAAGSELETQALMKYLLRHNTSIRAFISHHSYTQKWFTRWGYTNSTPPDHSQSLDLAQKSVAALQQEGGVTYNVGRPFELLYAYTGGSADWAKGVAGIKYAYTVELRDRGRFGFLLPANYVVPVGEELWAAVKVVASQLINETYLADDRVDKEDALSIDVNNDGSENEGYSSKIPSESTHVTPTAATSTLSGLVTEPHTRWGQTTSTVDNDQAQPKRRPPLFITSGAARTSLSHSLESLSRLVWGALVVYHLGAYHHSLQGINIVIIPPLIGPS